MQAVFISYRRETAAGSAGRLYDTLSAHFGDSLVFMDVDNIAPGDDFSEVLARALSSCRVIIVIIDPRWLSVRDQQGCRRLDNPRDFVRLEIENALDYGIQVLPVLVEGAIMPNADELPSSISALASRQAVEVTAPRFRYDTSRLISVVERFMRLSPGSASVGGRSSVFPANDTSIISLVFILILAVLGVIPWLIQYFWNFTLLSVIGSSALSLLCAFGIFAFFGTLTEPLSDLIIGSDGIEIRGSSSPSLVSWSEVDDIVYTGAELVVIPHRASSKKNIRVHFYRYEHATAKSVKKAVTRYWP